MKSEIPYIERPNRSLHIYAMCFLGFLYIPVLFLPLFSFSDSIYIKFPIEGWTLQWYRDMFANDLMFHSLKNSLKVGSATAVFSTILGVLGAKAVTRYRMPGKTTNNICHHASFGYTGNDYRCCNFNFIKSRGCSIVTIHCSSGTYSDLRSICYRDINSAL